MFPAKNLPAYIYVYSNFTRYHKFVEKIEVVWDKRETRKILTLGPIYFPQCNQHLTDQRDIGYNNLS